MFRLIPKLHSMDFNKNIEKYKFNPNSTSNSLNKKFFQSNDFYRFNEVIEGGENKIKNTRRLPPVYYYKKVTTPYKYNISSVPEYLIRTNEEKRFMEKLYKSLSNEKTKKPLRDLLNNTLKTNKEKKDYYKPKYIDIHKLLKFKPIIYDKLADPLNRNKTLSKEKENPSTESNIFFNSCPNDENKTTIENYNYINNEDNSRNKSKTINIEKKDRKNKEHKEQVLFKYKISDIFNLKKEPINLNKSAEKYLFRKNDSYSTPKANNTNTIREDKREIKFYNSSESGSDWIPNKKNQKKMGTNSSVSYNIICPNRKGNKFIRPSELNKNNLYNESTAFHRVKSISEFIDLTRVSATNTLGCFNRNCRIPDFKIHNSIGTNQLDAFHINRNLLPKPI